MHHRTAKRIHNNNINNATQMMLLSHRSQGPRRCRRSHHSHRAVSQPLSIQNQLRLVLSWLPLGTSLETSTIYRYIYICIYICVSFRLHCQYLQLKFLKDSTTLYSKKLAKGKQRKKVRKKSSFSYLQAE